MGQAKEGYFKLPLQEQQKEAARAASVLYRNRGRVAAFAELAASVPWSYGVAERGCRERDCATCKSGIRNWFWSEFQCDKPETVEVFGETLYRDSLCMGMEAAMAMVVADALHDALGTRNG